MLKRVLTILSGVIMGVGFLVVLGAAGSDSELISSIIVRAGIGLSLMGAGFIGLRVTNPEEF
jgi:hypothetical protein